MNEKLLAPGWYVVKETEKYELHRYWNGMRWSAPCYSDDPHEVVVRAMNTPADSDSDIKCLRPASLRPTEPAPRRACECQPGKCVASPDGRAIGRVSIISDLRCLATVPAVHISSPRDALAGAVAAVNASPAEQPRSPQTVPGRARLFLKKITASDILDEAAGHIRDRAATYDEPEGERSMAATVAAFNEITGHAVSESEGWLFMAVLKMVRDRTAPDGHADSQEDCAAYVGLAAEARRAGR